MQQLRRIFVAVVVSSLVVLLLFFRFNPSNDSALEFSSIRDKWLKRNALAQIIINYQTSSSSPSLPFDHINAKLSDVNVDTRPSDMLSDYKTAMKEVAKNLTSLPALYFERTNGHTNSKCSKYPDLFDIEFNNIYWQQLKTENETFSLYNAYYDGRKDSHLIKVLTIIDRIKPSSKVYCQFWYDDEESPIVVEALRYDYVWREYWNFHRVRYTDPYFIVCKLPKATANGSVIVPDSVSIVRGTCNNATNNLRIIHNRPEEGAQKMQFAVCVKGLDYVHSDLSVKLIEWIELIRVLGADKIFMYDLHVHPNISKVLHYYAERGMVELTPFQLPDGQPNLPNLQHFYLVNRLSLKRQNELITYNDCFYKNLYRYDFIALLDIDEVIVPNQPQDMTWADLLRPYIDQDDNTASFAAQNVYFLDNRTCVATPPSRIPCYLNAFNRVVRGKKFSKKLQGAKSFFSTKHVTVLHNHNPTACNTGKCKKFAIPAERAQLNHYRSDCLKNVDCRAISNDTVTDTTIFKYGASVIPKVIKAMEDLRFFRN